MGNTPFLNSQGGMNRPVDNPVYGYLPPQVREREMKNDSVLIYYLNAYCPVMKTHVLGQSVKLGNVGIARIYCLVGITHAHKQSTGLKQNNQLLQEW